MLNGDSMNLSMVSDKEFIQKLTEISETNLSNENFGVKELVQIAGTTQSYLSKRLQKIVGISVSRFISETRLRKAMKMIHESDLTAAEVAYKVGFGSATYFNNCFRNFYGYPPGEVKKRDTLLSVADNAGAGEREYTHGSKKRANLSQE